jgi:hypothetical protein
MSKHTSDTPDEQDGRHQARLFDIRIFIAALIGVYGLVLVLTGLFGTNEGDLAKAGGINVNLLAGLGMLVFGGLFVLWARLRPVVVPDRSDQIEDATVDT